MSKEEHGMIWIFSATLQNWEEKEIIYQIKQYALIKIFSLELPSPLLICES